MAGIVWSAPPSILVLNLKKYQRDLLTALAAICQYHGQQMQDDARQRATWQDRTGNARSGLFYAFEGAGLPPIFGQISGVPALSTQQTQTDSAAPFTAVIWLSHTMYYGVFLELSNGGKYAIIMSTIESHLPALETSLRNLVR